MLVLGAMLRGFRRVLGAPLALLGLWLANLLVALPAAVAVALALRESIGNGLVHEKLRDGFDMEWFAVFSDTATGPAQSFTPAISGAGAFFDNLEGWLTGRMFFVGPALVGVGVLWIAIWALLLGGVLESWAGPRQGSARQRFVRGCTAHFLRFVRLGLVAAVAYGLLYGGLRFLSPRFAEWTRDVTDERLVMLLHLSVYAVFALLLVCVRLVFDYAKIAVVVDRRRSSLLAALRGFAFVLLRPGRTFGLYFLMLALSAGLLAVYAAIAPGAGDSTLREILLALALGQGFLLLRLLMRLALLGGETALYEEFAAAEPEAG